MGYELHITRRVFHADDGSDITKQEWDAFVEQRPELELSEQHGGGMFFYSWSIGSSYDEPWLQWFEGSISTKNPDEPMIIEMVAIAKHFNANVQGDDGERYGDDGQPIMEKKAPSKGWLARIFGRDKP